MTSRSSICQLLLIAGCALLIGCQASREDEGGIGGTGLILGKVTSSEQLSIEGRSIRLDDARAIRNSEIVLSDAAQFNTGEYVSVSHRTVDGETVREIRYSAPVVGPVSMMLNDQGEIGVAGQRVELSDLLVLNGIDSTTELRVGELVEVSGYRVVENRIVATRLNRLMESSASTPLRLTGSISSIDLATGQIMINDARIDVSNLDADSPAIAGLSTGDQIVISAVLGSADVSLRALSLRDGIEINLGEAGDPALLTGAITNYISLRQPFDVRGFSVLLSESTILDDGITQRLVSSIFVTDTDPLSGLDEMSVEGQIDGVGSVLATRVVFAAVENRIDINGPIDGINVSQGSMSVNGIEVRVKDSTLFVDNSVAQKPDLQLIDLDLGQSVLIRANRLDSLSAEARQIIRLN